MITAVRMRKLDSDGNYSLGSETLEAAVEVSCWKTQLMLMYGHLN